MTESAKEFVAALKSGEIEIVGSVGDLVEAGRSLNVLVSRGMIKLQIFAVRSVARDGSFLLDSEQVNALIDDLKKARSKVMRQPEMYS